MKLLRNELAEAKSKLHSYQLTDEKLTSLQQSYKV